VVQQPTGSGVQLASVDGCDPDAAYNPARPCRAATAANAVPLPSAKAQPLSAVLQPAAPSLPQPASRSAAPGSASPFQPTSSGGGWAIQVGAFANPGLARAVAEGARAQAPEQLRSAALALQPTAPFGSTVLYRARLAHLSASAASSACTHLNRRQLPCIVVPPSGS
jgi:hypothetical protein